MTTETQQRELDERNERREKAYERGRENHRPKPALELSELRTMAHQAKEDESLLPQFQVAMASMQPHEFLLALEAAEWDRRHPWYSCFLCRDGKELPQGYMCERCGADNPRTTY